MSIAALIEAVEAGRDRRVLELSSQFGGNYTRIIDAFRGSLDAARALHDALLPGWTWTRWPQGDFEVRKGVGKFYAGASFDPARAWLLAILRAKEVGQ